MWSQRYRDAGEELLFGSEPNRYLRQHVELLPARGRVLCVADGEGRNSVWLAGQGFTVQATEISAVAVDKARRLAERSGVAVEFRIEDILDWDPPIAAYDAVVAVFIQFAAKSEQPRLFRQLKEALRPGGVLLLIGYTPKQLEYRTGGPPCAEQLYDEDLLRRHFGDLEAIRLDVFEDFLEEGKAHHGQSALIGLVARRPDR
jgi:SAM-dependent methyltransferase